VKTRPTAQIHTVGGPLCLWRTRGAGDSLRVVTMQRAVPALKDASESACASSWRFLHDDEARAYKILGQPVRNDSHIISPTLCGRFGAIRAKTPGLNSQPRLAGGRRMTRGGRVLVRRNVEVLSGIVIRQRLHIDQGPLIPVLRETHKTSKLWLTASRSRRVRRW
jgi:hypothetical protein